MGGVIFEKIREWRYKVDKRDLVRVRVDKGDLHSYCFANKRKKKSLEEIMPLSQKKVHWKID